MKRILPLLFGFFTYLASAQSYQGEGVRVVNELLKDTVTSRRVEMKLSLATYVAGKLESEYQLEYKRFDENWYMKNSEFVIVGNLQYDLVLNEEERVAFLSLAGEQATGMLQPGSMEWGEVTWIRAEGNEVEFSIVQDTIFSRMVYRVDTVNHSLVSIEMEYVQKEGEPYTRQVIRYHYVRPLTKPDSIPALAGYIEIDKKKSRLQPAFSTYFLYDNRRKP